MSEPAGPDELALDAALLVLEAPLSELEARLAGVDDATAALRRQQLEAFAALAWTLPVASVSTQARQRLLGRLQGDETVLVVDQRRAADPAQTGPVSPPSPGPMGVLDPPAPAAAAAPGSEAAGPRAAGVPPAAPRARRIPAAAPMRPVRSYRWALPLAALFAIAAVGLGWHDWRRGEELDRTRQALAAARQEGQQLALRLRSSEETQAMPASLEAKLREMETQLSLVTARGTLVCRLRPSPGAPARDAGGLLYVADDHQHWYLRAQNLPSPGEGRVYKLWFMVGDRAVAAGTFELVGDEAVLASPTMPAGTSAALVTIEPAGTAPERPSGPVVLFGKQMTRLL